MQNSKQGSASCGFVAVIVLFGFFCVDNIVFGHKFGECLREVLIILTTISVHLLLETIRHSKKSTHPRRAAILNGFYATVVLCVLLLIDIALFGHTLSDCLREVVLIIATIVVHLLWETARDSQSKS